MTSKEFKKKFLLLIDNLENPFHPLVFIHGKPKFGKNVYIGLFSEINAKGANIKIGNNCDIASFVSINVADSHKKCLGIIDAIEKNDIEIENNVFIGSHCFIKPGAVIGHHCVIASGTIVEPGRIPAYSLVSGNPMKIRKGYYKKFIKNDKSQ